MRSHTKEKPYSCDFENCEFKCSTSSILKVHKQVHLKEKPFKCEFDKCNFCCLTSSILKVHMRTHTGEKPFKCDFNGCDYSGLTSSLLKLHKRRHTGEKPYKCKDENCEYSSASSSSITRHYNRMHTKDGTQKKKKSEQYTYESLLKRGLDIKREHQVNFNCDRSSFCRIDFLHIKNGVIFAIENDEYQHEHYSISCETKRMMEVKTKWLEDNNNMPLVWIRYNPDVFFVDEIKKQVNKKDRITKIIELINKLSSNPNKLNPMTIYYMYYNTVNSKLNILDDLEYPEDLKEIVYSQV